MDEILSFQGEEMIRNKKETSTYWAQWKKGLAFFVGYLSL